MKLDRFHWTFLSVIVLLSALVAYLTLSPYRYFRMAGPLGLVRVSRFTGEAERLRLEGWKPMRPTAASVMDKHGIPR